MNHWNPAPKAEVHRQAWDVRAVCLELVVEADLQALVDEGTYSQELAERHREDIPLVLERLALHAASIWPASEVRRPEC